MRRYRYYIFDLDNTLVDSRTGYEEAFKTAFNEFDIAYDPDRYDEYISTPLDLTFSAYYPNSPCKYRDFLSLFINTYERTHMNGVKLFPDSKRCLKELSDRDCSIGIVSNSYVLHIESILSKLDIRDLFASVVGQDRVVFPKPDPEPVLLCLTEMDAAPKDSVMIGDSRNDILAGKNSHIDTVLIDRRRTWDIDVCANENISSLDEIVDN